ncbi:MAG: hypothetical protein A4E24_00377 [Methanomethylovorans sp. PtaU1.Bin093]|uniref:EMC6-like membrane protein n=1 Tax=Methanomethylovorans sp. PtaU1.Bin093 TaxID=1811679 RepID=UPI0009D00948|nr:hypothetical protein [Methanomethylovorans sp. PtaU1.Bin093]OPY21830.1 MAG: hypothetical protein A4E24_00377 [Methanomethylovorans sp. PtaU1.Bin093]
MKKAARQSSGKNKQIATQDASEVQQDKTAKGILAVKQRTPEEKRKAHIQGIIKTAVASILGIIAGVLANMQYGMGTETKWYAVITIVAILAFYAQRLIYPAIKISTKEFGFKDWFYVEFLVVDFCLVTWTLLLN